MSYATINEIKEAFVKLYGNQIIGYLRTGLEIADKNDWKMLHFAMDKEIVRNFLFGFEEKPDELTLRHG